MADTPAVTYIPWPIAHTPAPLENGQPVAGGTRQNIWGPVYYPISVRNFT